MKNLKAQFKLIIYFFLFLSISNIVLAKSLDKFSTAEDISNYFSGVLSINDNQYEKSYSYLKSLNNLEDSHYNYSQYYHYSLVALGKIKDAVKYSKKLNDKKLDNFESNLINIIYYLEDKDFKNAFFYLKKIENKNQPGSIQNLLFITLKTWLNFRNITDIESGLDLIDAIPEKFKNIKNIQKVFAYCYFDSLKTEKMFKQLTSNSSINYSRYYFFYLNYLISKKKENTVKEVIKSSLNRYPNNLTLNQLKSDLEKGKVFNNKFDCKNPADVIAEIFYLTSNVLATQNNYMISNFYLSLAKYLNPILIRQEKKEEAVNSLRVVFKKKIYPTINEIFDFAEFLKNNEKYEESIEHYSNILGLIDKKNFLYPQAVDGRGIAYERTDQWEKAEIDLLDSLDASPEDAYVINYLAYSWIEKGINIQKSLVMLRKANRLRPNDGYIIDSLGWALFKLKKYKEAKLYLELAVVKMASDPVITDHYGDSLWMVNKPLQARYYWNHVLKLEKTKVELRKKIQQKLLFGLKS